MSHLQYITNFFLIIFYHAHNPQETQKPSPQRLATVTTPRYQFESKAINTRQRGIATFIKKIFLPREEKKEPQPRDKRRLGDERHREGNRGNRPQVQRQRSATKSFFSLAASILKTETNWNLNQDSSVLKPWCKALKGPPVFWCINMHSYRNQMQEITSLACVLCDGCRY